MSDAVVLDATPLGILCYPCNPPQARACRQWLGDLLAAGRRVNVPEIANYEVRHEVIRRNRQVALRHLDQLGRQLEYVPLTTAAMRLAAELWVQARIVGQPTALDPALDADIILAAQALKLDTAVNPQQAADTFHVQRASVCRFLKTFQEVGADALVDH